MEEEISLIQSVFSSRALNWCLLILRLCDEYSYRFPDATEGFSKSVARSCTCFPLQTQEPPQSQTKPRCTSASSVPPRKRVLCVCWFFFKDTRAPYRTPSACANRAAYPDPPTVVPDPESIDARASSEVDP
jgi:hypothetical protein